VAVNFCIVIESLSESCECGRPSSLSALQFRVKAACWSIGFSAKVAAPSGPSRRRARL
jgi:hypothetical protein